MAFADTQKLTVELDLKGNLTSGLSKAARALQGFDRATSNTQQSLAKFNRNLQRGLVLGATAAVGGFIAVAKAAGDFEAQLNTIATIVDRGQIKGIGESLRKIARDTGLSLDDLTQGYYDLASAGVKGQLATDALNDAVKLGIGGLATTTETVNLLTTAINAYGLDSAGAAKATDQFAQAIADGTVKASEIAATFADVASVAKAYHVGIDQIAASYAVLTKQGVPAGEVATEMQRAIVSLINPTKDLETAEKKLGISFTKEIATKGLVGALQELRQYSDKTGIPLIALLGRIEAVKYTLQTTGPEFKGYNAELAKMGTVSGTAAAQMAERQQGLNFQLARLKALAKDAGITIGSALLPKLTPLVSKLNDFINANQGKIADFGTKLADGFEKFAKAVQKVDWQPFIDGLKLSADIAKSTIAIFRSLPEGLQAALVGGFALNKITGGLPTSIIKDAGGALLQQFASRGSSPANPMWVASAGGGVGGVGGAGGGLGLLGKAVLGVTVIGVTAEAAIAIGKPFADALPPELKGPNGLGWSQSQTAIMAARGQQTGSGLGLGGAFAGLGAVGLAIKSFAGKQKDDLVNLVQLQKSANSFLNDIYQIAVKGLKTAKSPAEIQKAVAAALAVVTKRGNATATGKVLVDLKNQLVHTTDPQTRRILKDAIAKVEHKLAGRALVQKQLDKADQIFKSSKSADQKLHDLKIIEKSLEHTSRSGQAKIRDKMEQVRKAAKYAGQQAAAAIKDKDLSVRVNTKTVVNAGFDIRTVIGGVTTIRRYGTATTSISAGSQSFRPPS